MLNRIQDPQIHNVHSHRHHLPPHKEIPTRDAPNAIGPDLFTPLFPRRIETPATAVLTTSDVAPGKPRTCLPPLSLKQAGDLVRIFGDERGALPPRFFLTYHLVRKGNCHFRVYSCPFSQRRFTPARRVSPGQLNKSPIPRERINHLSCEGNRRKEGRIRFDGLPPWRSRSGVRRCRPSGAPLCSFT